MVPSIYQKRLMIENTDSPKCPYRNFGVLWNFTDFSGLHIRRSQLQWIPSSSQAKQYWAESHEFFLHSLESCFNSKTIPPYPNPPWFFQPQQNSPPMPSPNTEHSTLWEPNSLWNLPLRGFPAFPRNVRNAVDQCWSTVPKHFPCCTTQE